MSERARARLAVLISGGGTNLQSIIDASQRGELSADVVLVVSSQKKAFGLTRASNAGIPTFIFKPRKYDTPADAASALLKQLKLYRVEYIALAGYLSLVPADVVAMYRNRITNIHNALLPKFGGKGMYGHHVHEAVLAAGETESGPTVHLVNEVYDDGQILEQVKVPVKPDDTPDTLAARVLEQEHKLYPKVLDKLIKGEYNLNP